MFRLFFAAFLAVLAVPANASTALEFRHIEAIKAYESLPPDFKKRQQVSAPVMGCLPLEWNMRLIPMSVLGYISSPLTCTDETVYYTLTILVDNAAELNLTGQGSLVPLLFQLDEQGRAVGPPIEFSECEIGVGCVRLSQGKYVILYGGRGDGNPRLSLSSAGN